MRFGTPQPVDRGLAEQLVRELQTKSVLRMKELWVTSGVLQATEDARALGPALRHHAAWQGAVPDVLLLL